MFIKSAVHAWTYCGGFNEDHFFINALRVELSLARGAKTDFGLQ